MCRETWERFWVIAIIVVLTTMGLAVPTATKAQTDQGKDTYSKWLSNVRTVAITIGTSSSSTAGASTVSAPSVAIPADTSVGRPALNFVLDATDTEGNFVVSSHKWLFFQEASNPNLYFVTDDDANNNNFIYVSGVSVSTVVANMNQYILNSFGPLGINDKDVNAVFNYIMDVPTDGTQNCNSGGVYLTGPNSTDGTTVSAIQQKYPSVNQTPNASEFNADCLDQSPTGWLNQWHVANTNNVGGGNCSLTAIFGSATTGLGGIFQSLISCLFTAIFVPIVNWAAQWVQSAAGVSYIRPPTLVAERPWPCVS